jgi:two-component system aerobic respiration control sensor histidine kinase ArcB
MPIEAENMSHLPFIDWEATVAMCNHDPSRAHALLSLLSEEIKKTQNNFKAAYFTKDVKTLRDELHRTLGGVVYLRLPQLEQALRTFHQSVKTEPLDWKECERHYLQMQKAIEAFRSEVAVIEI